MRKTQIFAWRIACLFCVLAVTGCSGESGRATAVIEERAPATLASIAPSIRPSSTSAATETAVSASAGSTTSAPTLLPTVPGDTTMSTLTYGATTLLDGATLEYALILPAGYDPQNEYPILLALPPGAQNRGMVDAGLNGYWAREARLRNWIVVSPAAPDGQLFFQGSEALLPEFLDQVALSYPPEGGKFHVAGISNGGISAFRIAVAQPDRFHSIMVLPGYPQGDDAQHLANLRGIPVAMYVGEQDTTWLRNMQETEAALQELGIEVSLFVSPDEGHVIQGVSNAELFDVLDSFRP